MHECIQTHAARLSSNPTLPRPQAMAGLSRRIVKVCGRAKGDPAWWAQGEHSHRERNRRATALLVTGHNWLHLGGGLRAVAGGRRVLGVVAHCDTRFKGGDRASDSRRLSPRRQRPRRKSPRRCVQKMPLPPATGGRGARTKPHCSSRSRPSALLVAWMLLCTARPRSRHSAPSTLPNVPSAPLVPVGSLDTHLALRTPSPINRRQTGWRRTRCRG